MPDLLPAFLDDIVAHPDDPSLWLILADWLDERDDPRAELVRLTWQLQYEPDHAEFKPRAARVQALIAGGMVPVRPTRTFGDIDFVWIAPGSFLMGSPPTESHHSAEEHRHRVRLTCGYWMSRCQITQGQWTAVLGDNPSDFNHRTRPDRVGGLTERDLAQLPAENMSWGAARAFCARLGRQLSQPVRLPTEAEWEYACRAGTTTAFSFGDDPKLYPRYAILSDTGNPEGTRPDLVGRRLPNAWGLHDMHGNVCEWVAESSSPYPTDAGESVDPQGPTTGPSRLVRGGTYHFVWWVSRAASRVTRIVAGSCDTGLRVCFHPA
jgi:uncharacterized protein (TIGR02996 family)